MTKSSWAISALTIVVIVLGIFQFNSCRDNTASKLQYARDSLSKKNDSLVSVTKTILGRDSVLRIRYRQDSLSFRILVDSFSRQIQLGRSQIQAGREQVKKLLIALQGSVQSGDTATQLQDLIALRRQLADISDMMNFQEDTHSAKEQVFTEQLDYRDSMIGEKNKIIDSLRVILQSKDQIIAGLLAQIDIAISQLKKHQRANVWRTIGEAALVIALIFKK